MANLLKRDIEDTIWSVLTSFGFNEECDKKGFTLDKNEASIVNTTTLLAKAETVAAVIESVFAVGNSSFRVTLSNEEIFNLLVLFGFENILRLDKTIKDGFSVITDHTEIAFGSFDADKSTAKININMILRTLNSDEDGKNDVSKSLAFAEADAEGVCYDVCYNLRVNGCIVEYYTQDGDINSAEEYAKKNGHSCIIRCFNDGKIEIKDFTKNEISVTDITEFLGYYNDDDCDCGHDHEHEHHCDCGHDHDYHCDCGHHHE